MRVGSFFLLNTLDLIFLLNVYLECWKSPQLAYFRPFSRQLPFFCGENNWRKLV